MRIIVKAADALLGRMAPKARAEAACIGESWEYCENGVRYFIDACGEKHVLGPC